MVPVQNQSPPIAQFHITAVTAGPANGPEWAGAVGRKRLNSMNTVLHPGWFADLPQSWSRFF